MREPKWASESEVANIARATKVAIEAGSVRKLVPEGAAADLAEAKAAVERVLESAAENERGYLFFNLDKAIVALIRAHRKIEANDAARYLESLPGIERPGA